MVLQTKIKQQKDQVNNINYINIVETNDINTIIYISRKIQFVIVYHDYILTGNSSLNSNSSETG